MAYHVTALSHTLRLLLFFIVFNAVRTIWHHKRQCDVIVSPLIRTALPIVVALSEIYFSNIY